MRITGPQGDLTFSKTETVKLGTAEIACHRHGRGETIICLHATGHSARDFLQLAHDLEDRFEFIAIDWPGQGDSPRGAVVASADAYADVLGGVIAALDIGDHYIIGNSIGGAAAIIHASCSPKQLKGLILCNPGGLQAVNFFARLYCRHMARLFSKGAQGHTAFGRKFRRYYEKTVLSNAAAEWRREEIIATGYDVAPILQEAWAGFAQPQADIRAKVAELSMPILYAWAEGDQAVAWSRSKKAATTAPNHVVAMFEGGHCAFLESPVAFQRALLKFAVP